jgi:hypothetical protein
VKRTHLAEAKDGKSMTVGELRTLVHALDSAGVDDGATMKARVTLGGGLRSITITEEAEPAGPPRVIPDPWQN